MWGVGAEAALPNCQLGRGASRSAALTFGTNADSRRSAMRDTQ